VVQHHQQSTDKPLTVILCTTALFLSGYVLQQRTLRDLRSAIAPRPSPKIVVPNHFTPSTTELADGAIIVLGDNNDGQEGGSVVEVRPTPPDNAAAGQQQKAVAGEQQGDQGDQGDGGDSGDGAEKLDGDSGAGQKPMSRAERRRRIKEEIKKSQKKSTNIYRPRRAW
jgi:hypothetical protein